MKCFVLTASFSACLLCAQVSMPGWLKPYPDATLQVRSYAAYTEASYGTSAAPAAVVEHYRKLFESAGLRFTPNFDGMGTTIRASAPECDLLLSVRAGESSGTSVKVSCAAKAQSYNSEVVAEPPRETPAGKPPAAVPAKAVASPRRAPTPRPPAVRRSDKSAPAPPLAWPDWLTKASGDGLAGGRGVDGSGQRYLESEYQTSAPIAEVWNFYREALNGNYYTTAGSQTPASGGDSYMEGTLYPEGQPGPRKVVRIEFLRDAPTGPTVVRVRFTTYGYDAHVW